MGVDITGGGYDVEIVGGWVGRKEVSEHCQEIRAQIDIRFEPLPE